jgi:hypothetical protein
MTTPDNQPTPHSQLLALKEALPPSVWPKEIEPTTDKIREHMGYGWCYFIPYNMAHVYITDEHALDIVTAEAERWLIGEGWLPSTEWGGCWKPHTDCLHKSLIEAIEWQKENTGHRDS